MTDYLKSSFFATFILLSSLAFSQSKKDLVNELSGLIQNKNRQSEVFYVDYTGKLDINGNQIPLNQVGMYYSEKKGPTLVFQCILKTKINSKGINFMWPPWLK